MCYISSHVLTKKDALIFNSVTLLFGFPRASDVCGIYENVCARMHTHTILHSILYNFIFHFFRYWRKCKKQTKQKMTFMKNLSWTSRNKRCFKCRLNPYYCIKPNNTKYVKIFLNFNYRQIVLKPTEYWNQTGAWLHLSEISVS